jgi:ATP-dependent RNA helicase RhlE
MSFENIGLSESILRAVEKQGYDTPSPIQEKVIPHILAGKDVLASAQTGTGKTAGFTLPMLEILSKVETTGKKPVRALVLTPTRELAAQVHESVESYSEFLDMNSTVIFGGVKQMKQVARIKKGIDILIATPGRLLDLVDQKLLFLDKVEFLVLDEADRMLDMGFARDLNKILALLPEKRQNLLFSATFSPDIKKLAKKFMYKPVLVEAEPENSTVDKILQTAYRVDIKDKLSVLINMINDGDWKQVLVFTRTKHRANKIAEKLNKAKITASAIHGNKSQGARTRALEDFKTNSIRVLVATDIAARGLDIPLLPHVINYELPNVPEDYVHRIGRTGRAGASGEAISLVAHDEVDYVAGIEKLLGEKFERRIIEGFEPKLEDGPPTKKQNGGGNRQQNRPKSKPQQKSRREKNYNDKKKRKFMGKK